MGNVSQSCNTLATRKYQMTPNNRFVPRVTETGDRNVETVVAVELPRLAPWARHERGGEERA